MIVLFFFAYSFWLSSVFNFTAFMHHPLSYSSLPPLLRRTEHMPRDGCLRVVIGIFSTSSSDDESKFSEWLPLLDYERRGKGSGAAATECGLNFVFVYGEPASRGPGRVILRGLKENMNEGKSFRWFEEAALSLFPDANYIFKMDTDIGFCPPTLLAMLHDAARLGAQYIGWPHTFQSCGKQKYCPPPSSSSSLSSWRYMSGGFYGMSRDVAARVAVMNRDERGATIGIEDLLMGQMIYRAVQGPQAVPLDAAVALHALNGEEERAVAARMNRLQARYSSLPPSAFDHHVTTFATECLVQRDSKGQPIIDPLDDCPVKHFASHHPLKLVPRTGPMCGQTLVDQPPRQADPSSTTTTAPVPPEFQRHQPPSSGPIVPYVVEVFMVGRLGNQMFQYASALGVARQLRMRGLPCIRTKENYSEPLLQTYFRGPFVSPCPPRPLLPMDDTAGGEFPARLLTYQMSRRDAAFDVTEAGYAVADANVMQAPLRFPSMNVHIRTFLQSWRYFSPAIAASSDDAFADDVKTEIQRAFQIKDERVLAAAKKVMEQGVGAFLSASRRGGDEKKDDKLKHADVTTVGIHVRRGDHLNKKEPYLRFPPTSYFSHAMDFFARKYGDGAASEQDAGAGAGGASGNRKKEVLFIVASDDVAWCKEQPLFKKQIEEGRMFIVESSSSSSSSENSLYPAWLLDFAVLSLCDGGSILTLGTFGWWAAFLGLGKSNVVYYGDAFDMEHEVNKGKVNLDDYFPPWWTPL